MPLSGLLIDLNPDFLTMDSVFRNNHHRASAVHSAIYLPMT